MSTVELLERLSSAAAGAKFDWNAARAEIVTAYQTAPEADRGALLQAYMAVMNMVERSGSLSAEDRELFQTSRREEYNLMLISECVQPDGNISPAALKLVTDREVAAARMAPDAISASWQRPELCCLRRETHPLRRAADSASSVGDGARASHRRRTRSALDSATRDPPTSPHAPSLSASPASQSGSGSSAPAPASCLRRRGGGRRGGRRWH